ncbi:MAG TPA: hypothetical protein VGG01_10215, partial [Xanthobacteraceae bacterium]
PQVAGRQHAANSHHVAAAKAGAAAKAEAVSAVPSASDGPAAVVVRIEMPHPKHGVLLDYDISLDNVK